MKNQFVSDGPERLSKALAAYEAKLRKAAAAKFAAANPEEKLVLEMQLKAEVAEEMKRLKPSPYALFAKPNY